MKRIFAILLMLGLLWAPYKAYPVDEFLTGEPEGIRNISLIDDYVEDNNVALLRGLAHSRRNALLVYASAASITVQAGEVFCTNSAATVTHTRANTSSLTLDWDNIDTPSEANSTTYYVYAVGDAATATFTGVISISSSAPSGVTYYNRLGSFYNNASGNIEQVTNDSIVGTVPAGAIVMWHGLITNIPSGWVLCDGTNNTPDLREKFVRGAAASTEAGGTGGADTNSATHTYSGTTSTKAIDAAGGTSDPATNNVTTHSHTFSGTSSAPSDTNNMPAYYAILFIMKQ